MSQSDQFDNYYSGSDDGVPESGVNEATETGTDVNEVIETVPDVSEVIEPGTSLNETTEPGTDVVEIAEGGTDITPYNNSNPYGNSSPYNNSNPYGNSSPYNNSNPYGGSTPYNNSNLYGNSAPYNNGNPYGGSAPYNNGNPYGSNAPYNNSNPYGSSTPYNNSNPYIGSQAQNANPYNAQYNNNNQYNANASNGNGFYNGQAVQNNNPYGGSSYNGQTAQNSQQNRYGNPPYGNGNPPYGNNQYSPYAAPPKKSNTGLIIGIVIGIIVLFLIAVFALAYKLVTYTTEKTIKRNTREEYNFDYDDDDGNNNDYDDYDNDGHHNDHDHYYDDDDFFGGYDDDYDYNYDDYFDYDYDDYFDYYYNDNSDDDRYYTLHNEIRSDLSYSVKMEDFEYDTTYKNVDIRVTYPVVEGKDVPNLDKINSTIKDEVDFITEYFEDEYQDYMSDDSDYFIGVSEGYVAYMDEEKLSIAFNERISSDYFSDVFLYSINIDMENGIILDNESLLSIDDDFSVDFRKRSEIQNSEASTSYLSMMTDQEITKRFKSSDIIVFYTPMGMEIGFNFDEGWVTVTYEDYEKYLKVF